MKANPTMLVQSPGPVEQALRMQGAVSVFSQIAAAATKEPAAGGLGPNTPRDGLLEVGVSGAWRKLLAQARMAAPHIQLALIEGEAGCGKRTLARYLFSVSALGKVAGDAGFERHDAREWLLVADPAHLVGCLYLDRVDLLASPGQGLLLSVLKSLPDRSAGRYLIVASSQSSLREMAERGQFLPEVAFRLTAVRFVIPPLRARKEDIVPLSEYLLDRICCRYQQRRVSLAPEALGRLLQHDWPGNVRELESVLEAALLEASEGVIRPGDLSLSGRGNDARVQTAAHAVDSGELSLDGFVRRHVQYVLDLNHGNKLRAARQLGISRSTLYRILESDLAEPLMERAERG